MLLNFVEDFKINHANARLFHQIHSHVYERVNSKSRISMFAWITISKQTKSVKQNHCYLQEDRQRDESFISTSSSLCS